jgi:hypothetical protein
MSYANQVHTKLDYTRGFFTYSTKELQDQKTHDNLREKYVQAIIDYIICDNWSPYYEINTSLFVGLMGRQKVMLGDMPEVLLRMILGNTILIEEARDIFKAVLTQIEKIQGKLSIRDVTLLFFSHIFLAPKDLYMTAVLKNVLRTCFSVLIFVGSPHYVPIQKYWIPPPEGINYTQATTVPKRILNETDEHLIEKQAIFDVLLETRIWSEKYIVNPFPYIERDLKKMDKDAFDSYKKTFYVNLRKYETFKDKMYEKFGEVRRITDKEKGKVSRLTDLGEKEVISDKENLKLK